MVDPFTKVTRQLDLTAMLGLEIGALINPRVTRDQTNVRYLDHLSTEGLRDKYRHDPNVADHLHEIVDVDYVATPGKSLPEVVGADVKFDYVIASHLVEHVPNLIGWFREVADILVPSGFICLVVPDLRYTFDARRPPTTPAQVIDTYLRQVTAPTSAQVFDFYYEITPDIPVPELWSGERDITSLRRYGDDAAAFAFRRCEHVLEAGDYEDIHCSTFTPASFLEILEVMTRLDLWDFRIVDFFPTDENELEFFVTMQKVAPGASRAGDQLESIADARTTIAEHDASSGGAPSGPLTELSAAETKLIEFKRSALFNARRLSQKVPVRRRNHAAS